MNAVWRYLTKILEILEPPRYAVTLVPQEPRDRTEDYTRSEAVLRYWRWPRDRMAQTCNSDVAVKTMTGDGVVKECGDLRCRCLTIESSQNKGPVKASVEDFEVVEGVRSCQ